MSAQISTISPRPLITSTPSFQMKQLLQLMKDWPKLPTILQRLTHLEMNNSSRGRVEGQCANIYTWTWLLLLHHFSFSFVRWFSSVQPLSRVRLFAAPWIAACQASLSITNSQSSLKLTSMESVMPSSHLILCHPLLLPPIPPSIRVFSNPSVNSSHEVAKVLEFQFSIIP